MCFVLLCSMAYLIMRGRRQNVVGPKRISLFHDIEYQRGKKAFYVAQVHLHLPLSRTFLPWLKRCHTLAISGASTIFGPADAAKPIPGRINSALMTQVAKVAPLLKRLVLHSASDSTVSKALSCLKNLEGSVRLFVALWLLVVCAGLCRHTRVCFLEGCIS